MLLNILFNFRNPAVAVKLDTGEIYSSKCTCVQRLAGRCNHVATILYMLEEMCLGLKPKIFQTVTDVACYWKNRGAINNKKPGPIGIHSTLEFKYEIPRLSRHIFYIAHCAYFQQNRKNVTF